MKLSKRLGYLNSDPDTPLICFKGVDLQNQSVSYPCFRIPLQLKSGQAYFVEGDQITFHEDYMPEEAWEYLHNSDEIEYQAECLLTNIRETKLEFPNTYLRFLRRQADLAYRQSFGKLPGKDIVVNMTPLGFEYFYRDHRGVMNPEPRIIYWGLIHNYCEQC